jgi:hypothetical protein
MEVLIAALVVSGCAALGTLAVRWRRRRARAGELAAEEARPRSASPTGRESLDGRELDHLREGDVVLHDGLDLVVSGVARLTEGATCWTEARLADGSDERWLVVRPSDLDCVVVGRLLPRGAVVLGLEPSESMEHDGRIYSLQRHGYAAVAIAGELADGVPSGECRFWDYGLPGSGRLWVRGEQVFVGERVRRHLVVSLPGS